MITDPHTPKPPTVDGAKLWCVVRVESSASFTGYSEERFSAIAYVIGEDHLTFSLPFGGRKVFNWHKMLWFDTSEIHESESESSGREWVRLEDLPAGFIFVTQGGLLAVKSEYSNTEGRCMCILLQSGEYAHFEQGNATLVSAIEVKL